MPTAVADIWAGIAIAGAVTSAQSINTIDFVLLTLVSVCLYAAGVVLNDVFDASLDAIERPERPIPKGMVSRQAGFIYGTALVIAGIVLAFAQGSLAGILSLFLVFCILIYDGWAKHLPIVGPLFMGACRGINLLLGICITGSFLGWEYALIPVVYIFAVTQISRGEVYAGNKLSLVLAGILYALVVWGVLYLNPSDNDGALIQLALLLLWILANSFVLIRAFRNNSAANIKRAVITGVLGIILLDAAMAAPYAPLWYLGLIVLLLPLSAGLSKLFRVT